jgi:hypothetical protein
MFKLAPSSEKLREAAKKINRRPTNVDDTSYTSLLPQTLS